MQNYQYREMTQQSAFVGLRTPNLPPLDDDRVMIVHGAGSRPDEYEQESRAAATEIDNKAIVLRMIAEFGDRVFTAGDFAPAVKRTVACSQLTVMRERGEIVLVPTKYREAKKYKVNTGQIVREVPTIYDKFREAAMQKRGTFCIYDFREFYKGTTPPAQYLRRMVADRLIRKTGVRSSSKARGRGAIYYVKIKK